MSKAEVEAKRHATCCFCGTPFIRKCLNANFCCNACRKKYENNGRRSKAEIEQRLRRMCPSCGKQYIASNGNQIYCSRGCWLAASKTNIRLTVANALVGSGDPYVDLLRKKLQQEQELFSGFDDVLSLDADERREIVSSWPEEKRKALRSFYIKQYGLSSGNTILARGIDTDDSDEIRMSRQVDLAARSSFERIVFDEDNTGFEAI